MSGLGLFGAGNWLGIVSTILFIISIYFTFTFFEYLKTEDHRLRKQSKIAAVICISLALMIPAVYNLFINYRMMM